MSNKKMRNINLIKTVMVGLMLLPMMVLAKPKIELEMFSEKEVIVEENGKQLKKVVQAKDIQPGEEIIISIRYQNTGDEVAKNISIKNPVPEGTVYVLDSAKGHNSQITFSIDQGKTFKKPSLLTYEHVDSSGKRVKSKASYEQYSHIQWVVETVMPGKKGSVSFRVKVK